MAKKAELLEQAKTLNLEVTEKNTIAEITAAIESASADAPEAPKEEVKVAKAGKRSAKAIAEAEEKEAKEERKAEDSEEAPAKPVVVQITRSKLERSGKNFREASKLVTVGEEYSIKKALELAVATSKVKFDATVEMHIRLNVDPKQADQNIREIIVLPEGTGKEIRVAVFGEADDIAAAKKAGADIAGGDEFLQQLDKGVIDFDVLVATPMVMKKLGKYARILGPKGLMPNPKSGTVTKDVAKAIKQSKAGKVEIRVDEAGISHLGIGKVSFGADRLYKNAQAVFSSIKGAKPANIKGGYVISIYTSASMGPSIKIQNTEL